MAVKKQTWKTKAGCRWRVSWRNPITKLVEAEYFSSKDYPTEKDAELAAREHDLSIKRRIKNDPMSFSNTPDAKGLTFKELAQAYYAARLRAGEISASTVTSDLYRCDTVLFPTIGKLEAEAVTEDDMAAIVRAYRDRGVKQNSINRAVSIVKAIYTWGKADGRIKSHPVRDFECKRVLEEKIPPPTWPEFWAIHDHAAPHLQRSMILSVALGVRVGSSELLKLRKSETWFDSKEIRVWSARKRQRLAHRDVDLMPWVVDYLRAWKKKDEADGFEVDHWIHYKGKPISTFKRAWAAALVRAKIARRINPYSLRHLHATQALEAGADVGALAANMGTSPEVIRKHYQHIKRALRKAAIETLPDLSGRPGAEPEDDNKSDNKRAN